MVVKQPTVPERVRLALRLPGVELGDVDALVGVPVSVAFDDEPLHGGVIVAVSPFSGELLVEVTATRWPSEACRSEGCGKPIIWAQHRSRRNWVPLDAVATSDGTYAVQPGGATPDGPGPLVCHEPPQKLRFGRRDLRRSHFATCPDAAKWRPKR